ncbi:LysM peptidoglycan-binding domain-containing protein [Mesorhizobium sp. RP14(2022)]|uniref:LysM peptidoglycan-binding domain-containing protein n=1 Tax=Mesorhizobium liriopis TaxID=2953882 RepID=A0ABT1C792_9HYPH|nr:LysM peptidoglycan-binding domain-containing protein [Mesorhizobium liriopis]MCO6050696.1 LysM peptidoglycan-binding domain-containing protein [Mesorhizobium liriopis]
MANKPLKIFLFVLGGVLAVTGAAYVAGRWQPSASPSQQAAQNGAVNSPVAGTTSKEGRTTDVAASAPKGDRTSVGTEQATTPPADMAQPEQGTAPSSANANPAAAIVATPSFDVVRVEGDGSAVVAGQAAPNAKVELRLGGKVLGSAQAGPGGDFAIVLDQPLEPGNHQIELQATGPDGKPVVSPQTATVSVPMQPNGQVLAMVDQPGEASRILTAPQPDSNAAVQPAQPMPDVATQSQASGGSQTPTAQSAPSKTSAPSGAEVAVTETQPRVTVPAGAPGSQNAVAVKAVEIEGRKVFVAGSAAPGATVRVYAGETLLGDAKASPDGQFLVEAQRDLAVGNYVVRADVLGADGKVTARAAVPFQREPGETLAAVAPSTPAKATAAPTSDATTSQTSPAAPGTPAGAVGAQSAADGPIGEQAAAQTNGAGSSEPGASTAQSAAGSGQGDAHSADTAVASAHTAAQTDENLSPALQNVDGAVIIRRGDNLWRISRRVYGFGTRYSTIYLANQQQITNPNRIWPGQVFTVPNKSAEGEAANMGAMGEQSVSNPPAAN